MSGIRLDQEEMKLDRDNYNKMTSPFFKLVLNNISLQIMITIFAILVYVIFSSLTGQATADIVVTSLFVPAYCFSIYQNNWATALRDRNLVQYGHIRENRKRGFLSGILAALPLFIYTMIAIVYIYRLGPECYEFGIYKICAAPYILFSNFLNSRAPYLMLLYSLCSPVFAALGYHNGYKEYRIWDHILYEDGVKPKRKTNNSAPKARKTRR